MIKNSSNAKRGISTLCKKISDHMQTHPQGIANDEQKEWRTTISHKRLEPIKHHPNTTRYSDPIKPRLGPMLWSSNGRPPSGGIRTNKQSTHFPMQSVCKKLHHVRNNELIFMYVTQRKVKQTFTWLFLAQISQIPTTSKRTGQSKLFWWIC